MDAQEPWGEVTKIAIGAFAKLIVSDVDGAVTSLNSAIDLVLGSGMNESSAIGDVLVVAAVDTVRGYFSDGLSGALHALIDALAGGVPIMASLLHGMLDKGFDPKGWIDVLLDALLPSEPTDTLNSIIEFLLGDSVNTGNVAQWVSLIGKGAPLRAHASLRMHALLLLLLLLLLRTCTPPHVRTSPHVCSHVRMHVHIGISVRVP